VLVFLTYLLFTKYRYRIDIVDILQISNRYRIEIEILISSHYTTGTRILTYGCP